MDASKRPHREPALHAILGLAAAASPNEIRAAGQWLLAALRARQADLDDAAARAEVTAEIDELERRLRAALDPSPPGSSASREDAQRPHSTAGARRASGRLPRSALAKGAAALGLALVLAWAGGLRIVHERGEARRANEPPPVVESARLLLSGSLTGATLRVLDADRERLFVKTDAQNARVTLEPGRYALEVSREDCPDRWTRSVFFEAGTTARFEPVICRGEGRLTIRSNVSGDRLRIDGFDVGQTGPEAHRLPVGDHEIRVDKKGYVPFESRVRIRPDEALELRADLVALAAAGSAPPPVGRPLPFRVTAPTPLPVELPEPEAFDLAELGADIAPKDLAHDARGLLDRAGLADLPDGGSTAWHDRVSGELLRRFDRDGSGRIDRLDESEAIGCPLWRAIETDFDRGGLGLSMARYFGFDGSEWHPGALGFARAQRSAAYAKMRECGLQA